MMPVSKTPAPALLFGGNENIEQFGFVQQRHDDGGTAALLFQSIKDMGGWMESW
jgi:hypothetical protein